MMRRSEKLNKNNVNTELTMGFVSPFCDPIFAFKQLIVSPGF